MAWVEPAFSLAIEADRLQSLGQQADHVVVHLVETLAQFLQAGLWVSLLMRVQAYQVAVHRHTLADPLAVYGGETAMPMA